MKLSVSIIVPAYNEESGISDVLTQLTAVMKTAGVDHEILVVDDGSQDHTRERVAAFEGVILLKHASNRGYGAAIKTGLRHARHDLICITDADCTYPNDRIPDMIHRLEDGYDMVVGSRTGRDVVIPAVRRTGKWMIGKLANVISGEKIPDINSGLRVFRKKIAWRMMNLLPDGFSFTTTITLGMLANGYAVDYYPINYHVRQGKSKIRPVKDTLGFIQLILRLGLFFAPLKIFAPLSGLVLLIGIAWGFFSAYVLGRLADVSTIVIVMAALQIGVIGLLAEIINHRTPGYFKDDQD